MGSTASCFPPEDGVFSEEQVNNFSRQNDRQHDALRIVPLIVVHCLNIFLGPKGNEDENGSRMGDLKRLVLHLKWQSFSC